MALMGRRSKTHSEVTFSSNEYFLDVSATKDTESQDMRR